MINSDEMAPKFTLPRDNGPDITLSDLQPTAVVLFFYPKDDTPGCTIEARDFTAMHADFAKAGTTVLGISRDSIAAHEKFRAKFGLSVDLLSDEDGSVCADYGVWVEKSNFGKKYMGIERTTFLIDGTGRLARIWRKVKAQDHAHEVLKAARALNL